jgi:hypothetical protein
VGHCAARTAFLPTEDQGSLVLGLQLPDSASLEQTNAVLAKATAIVRPTRCVDQVIEIAGILAPERQRLACVQVLSHVLDAAEAAAVPDVLRCRWDCDFLQMAGARGVLDQLAAARWSWRLAPKRKPWYPLAATSSHFFL